MYAVSYKIFLVCAKEKSVSANEAISILSSEGLVLKCDVKDRNCGSVVAITAKGQKKIEEIKQKTPALMS